MRHKKYSYEDAILYGSTADTRNIKISLCFRQTARSPPGLSSVWGLEMITDIRTRNCWKD